MRQSNMSVLLSLLSFLLVTAARDGRQASLAIAEGAVLPNSASTVMAYWQAMLPDSPMPLAILELLTPPNEAYHGVLHNGYTHGYRTSEHLHFVEDLLTPAGSMVTPYILPIATRAPFLRRNVADSIPMSTKNFNDILEAFAPVSLAMADGIWSTLDTCEHPKPLDGEKWACVTSIESMVELAMSELGTREVRAISSDVPANGIASGRYKVVEARTVTDSKAKTMTCHSMKFPYAVYYCHAINPTRVYAVTLQDEDGGAPEMEALALCHLDTSKFDRENPLFVKQHLKPGDAALCHFISRDTVLWVPAAGTHGGGEAAAAQ